MSAAQALSSSPDLVSHWLERARRAEIRTALEAIYAQAAARIAARGPACWASGRCCNFVNADHLLYVTGLEAAYLLTALSDADAATSTLPMRENSLTLPVLDLSALSDAPKEPGCPFQRSNLCSLHVLRPLGCRIYFCDRSAQHWQQELYENLLAELRLLHERFQIEYRYSEWRSVLAMFSDVLKKTGSSPDRHQQ